ncbi:hypothetical protein [Luteolibacter marinus]|uniref:hypothetical protein n=1 Tax=Luteolibacter marinus TaxID=2776705 RepID=UPI00186870E0|nr:hypothetical protein [Luteolibacter marinus]
MKPSPRLFISLMTHGLAIAAGWAIYQEMGPGEKSGAAAVSAPASKHRDRSSKGAISAERILATAMESPPLGSGANDDAATRSDLLRMDPEVLGRIDTIAVPADFAEALDGLLATAENPGKSQSTSITDSTALGYLWMSKDPRAFFAWLDASTPEKRGFGSFIARLAFAETYRREGADVVIPMIEMTKTRSYELVSHLATLMGTAADATGVLKLKGTISGSSWRFFVERMGSDWPPGNLEELADLAVACGEPKLLIAYRQGEADQGAFLAEILGDESLPEEFRQKLKESPSALQSIWSDPRVPLDTRLKIGAGAAELVRNDVNHLLADERDWGNAFRNGQVTAQEVLDHVYAGTPELAQQEPDAIRELVFRELAEENPAEAMSLLADLPEAGRNDLVLHTSRSHFNDVEPHKFLEMLQQVPSDTPELWEGRLDAWNRRGFTNHERLRDGYVEWVRHLPPGIDREMGLYSLARAVDGGNPELAASLRSEVTDTELRKRISLHR